MSRYLCHFLDPMSSIANKEVLDAQTDREALQRAEVLFDVLGPRYAGYEVWERGQRIYLHMKPTCDRQWSREE